MNGQIHVSGWKDASTFKNADVIIFADVPETSAQLKGDNSKFPEFSKKFMTARNYNKKQMLEKSRRKTEKNSQMRSDLWQKILLKR
jgi:hypothetical protein